MTLSISPPATAPAPRDRAFVTLPESRWRAELFRALYESLNPSDQQWVMERITHYLRVNEEQHIEARL